MGRSGQNAVDRSQRDDVTIVTAVTSQERVKSPHRHLSMRFLTASRRHVVTPSLRTEFARVTT